MTTTANVAKPHSAPDSSGGRALAPDVPEPAVFGKRKSRPLFEGHIVRRAISDAIAKLDPRHQLRNPVMFVVEVGSMLTTLLFVLALAGTLPENPRFVLAVSLWLWFTVLFANFAE